MENRFPDPSRVHTDAAGLGLPSSSRASFPHLPSVLSGYQSVACTVIGTKLERVKGTSVHPWSFVGHPPETRVGLMAATATLPGCSTSHRVCSSVASHNLKMWEAVESRPTLGIIPKKTGRLKLVSVLAWKHSSTVFKIARVLLSFHPLGLEYSNLVLKPERWTEEILYIT